MVKKIIIIAKKTEMLSPRSQSGLEAKILASASASNIWPRPGLSLQQKNQQPRRDRQTNLFVLFFADYTGHHTMIEDSYCARENEKLNCVVWIIMI